MALLTRATDGAFNASHHVFVNTPWCEATARQILLMVTLGILSQLWHIGENNLAILIRDKLHLRLIGDWYVRWTSEHVHGGVTPQTGLI